jgi:outer membrane protein assembly factor BamB
VFFATDKTFGALDLVSGRLLWKKSIEGKCFGANLDYSSGTLDASIGEWKLMACNPKTGKEQWSIKRQGFS